MTIERWKYQTLFPSYFSGNKFGGNIIYICNFTLAMKRLLPIISLFCAAQTFAQVPLDSAYRDIEMEDSISSLAIKPIKHPSGVLSKIVNKVLEDWEQQPKACKYRIEETARINTPSMYTVKAILLADANIMMTSKDLEELTYSGSSKLTRGDSALIRSSLMLGAEVNGILCLIQFASSSKKITKHYAFRQLMRAYHIKVYSISDASGRGVYRVDFSPKKKRNEDFNWRYDLDSFTGSAYFDSNTFHVTQVKVDNVYRGSSFISYRPSKKPTASPTNRYRYYMDFDVKGGMAVIKQIRSAIFKDNKLLTKRTVQRIE